MKEYIIKTCDKIDFSTANKAEIDTFKWLEPKEPKSYAKVIFLPGKGFAVRLTCIEKNPVAKHLGVGASVCLDSALEFFADFAGDGKNYLNVEANSADAVLSQFGPDRYTRRDVSELFPVKSRIEAEFWTVEYFLDIPTLSELFGLSPEVFKSGYSFRGNFYKCGDNTPSPHYGMWNEVKSDTPDYHRPESFGKITIE